MKDDFLHQTAKDYDMSYAKVKEIHDRVDSDKFYDALEEYVKERANRGIE